MIGHRQSLKTGDAPVRCVEFAPDGRTLAAGAGRDVLLAHARGESVLRRLTGHGDAVNDTAFAPEGGILATASSDRTIRLWDTETGALRRVLAGGSRHVHLQDLPVRCAQFLPDGRTLVSCGTNNYVTFWDPAGGKWDRKVWTNHAARGYRDGCHHLALSRDGRRCAVAGGVDPRLYTGQVSLFAVEDGLRLLWNRGYEGDGSAVHVAFAPDGGRLLSCGRDRSVRLWDAAGGRAPRLLTGPEGTEIAAALFTPDGGRVVAAARDGALRIWDAASGALLACTPAGGAAALALALSPDGAALAAGREDGTLEIWDLEPDGGGGEERER